MRISFEQFSKWGVEKQRSLGLRVPTANIPENIIYLARAFDGFDLKLSAFILVLGENPHLGLRQNCAPEEYYVTREVY